MTNTIAPAASYAVGLKTDVGVQRSHNEDAAEVFEVPTFEAAFVVCDGMGGLRAGDVASREAVRVVQKYLSVTLPNNEQGEINAHLRAALVAANDAVNALNAPAGETVKTASGSLQADDAPTQKREGDSAAPASGLMGTTCVAGVVQKGVLHLAHAGDSRAYLFRGGQLSRLTEDHSFVAERVKAGDMTEAEARVSRFRNMITRAIGIDPNVDPDVQSVPLQAGDTVLVCSDGLTTMVEDQDIAQSLHQTYKQAPEKAASVLVDMANKKGGEDNVTVLIVRALSGDGSLPKAARIVPAPEPVASASGAGKVLDMDAPPPSRRTASRTNGGGSPFGAALLGAVLGLGLLAALVFLVPPVKQRIVSALGGASRTPGTATLVAPPTAALPNGSGADLANLAYDAPVRFAEFLARGDTLAYGRGEGLYFISSGAGKVASLSRTGAMLQTATTVDIAPSTPLPIAPTHLFMTADAQGNVYLSFTKRKVIEKRSPDGRILATLKGFEQPEAVAVDDDGNVYVVDFNQIKICRAHPKSAEGAAPKPPAAPAPAPSAASAAGKNGNKPAPAGR